MDRVVLITGAANGIGKAIAEKFHQAGYKLILNDISWKDKPYQGALYSEGNISDLSYCEELVKEGIETFEQIDVLVNNAGITRDNLIMRMSEADYDSVMDVNAKGTFNMMKAIARPMMRNRSGRIINMASVVGIAGNAGQVNYAASKGAVISMTKTMSKELGSRNILVNAIAPGFIKSDMTDELAEDWIEKIVENIPLGQLGSPEDVANLALFLASEDSSYITGQVISIDGGLSI